MDMLEAMHSRHTVRAYTNKPIPDDIVSLLTRRVAHDNQKYGTAITLRTEDTTAFGPIFKLIRAKGVRNFLIMSANLREGEDPRELDERLGYAGADLMLYAQTLGLNTWWAGGTYSRKIVDKMAEGNRTIAVIASDTERSKASLTNPNPFPKSANTTVRPLDCGFLHAIVRFRSLQIRR